MSLSVLANKSGRVMNLNENQFRVKHVEADDLNLLALCEDKTGRWQGPFRSIGCGGICEGVYLHDHLYTYYCRDILKDGRFFIGFWMPGEYHGALYKQNGDKIAQGRFHDSFKMKDD